MNRSGFTLLFGMLTGVAFGQKAADNYLSWHPTRKLTVQDFTIKRADGLAGASFGQYVLGYSVNGFDFLTKNFNKKVSNYLIKSASYIDTTDDVESQLRYQQTLFDMAEVYARQFRQALKANRKKIASGTQFIKALDDSLMTTFAKRRLAYESETKSGSEVDAQERWERTLTHELDLLAEFAADQK